MLGERLTPRRERSCSAWKFSAIRRIFGVRPRIHTLGTAKVQFRDLTPDALIPDASPLKRA